MRRSNPESFRRDTLDCFAALAMTERADTPSHPRGLSRPSFAPLRHLRCQKAQGRPGAGRAPTVHCAKIALREAAQRHTGEAKHTAFPAQWFDGLCRVLPGERCTIAPVALQMTDAPARSGHTHHRKTWRTDPGRQDDTVLPYASHTGRVRDGLSLTVARPALPSRADVTGVHRRSPHVRDDRDTPL
ncbi:hypothetical protein ACVIIV_005245 [Bradyrhizobium sp. USDA 4354]